ncbi:MAG: aldo/keto reductase [Candidatus Dormibacteria bacterium]
MSLGSSGLRVSALGLGCVGMSRFYGPADEAESIAVINRALDLGISLLDTADVYGDGHNEELVGRAIAGRRQEAVVATKFSIVHGPAGGPAVDGRPEHVRSACEASLRRLKTTHLDLFYQHRVDPLVPVEETVGAMAELVEAGKVRYLGLSEASAETVRRAAAVHPIAALQSEWSLWTRDLEAEVLEVARASGVGIVPYSPLGRGFLTGAIKSPEDFAAGDFRRHNPRFMGDNFARNLHLVEEVRLLADEKGCTPGQLALAWLMAQGEDVVPIPGTTLRAHLDENIGACNVVLETADLRRLETVAPPGMAAGARYPEPHAYGESPLPGPVAGDTAPGGYRVV